jgi:hypothetical protein
MSRTFGAPSGAVKGLGKSGLDCSHVRPICPANGGKGGGNTVLESSRTAVDAPCASADPDTAIINAVVARKPLRIIRASV